eukprot:5582502-Pleurochrysis_carterae.AAC.1
MCERARMQARAGGELQGCVRASVRVVRRRACFSSSLNACSALFCSMSILNQTVCAWSNIWSFATAGGRKRFGGTAIACGSEGGGGGGRSAAGSTYMCVRACACV